MKEWKQCMELAISIKVKNNNAKLGIGTNNAANSEQEKRWFKGGVIEVEESTPSIVFELVFQNLSH